MAKQPPKRLELELTEGEVKEDLVQILESMSKMRSESLVDKGCTDAEFDEYIHLTYRLACCLEGIADGELSKRVDRVAKAIAKDESLLLYDPMQDGHWRKKNRKFARALDEITITIMGDSFNSSENNHHVLQAIKYLAAKDEDPKEVARVYDTMKPFQGHLPIKKARSWLKSLFASLLGYSYKADDKRGLCLDLGKGVRKAEPCAIESIVKQARNLGYTSVNLAVDNEGEAELRRLCSDVRVSKKAYAYRDLLTRIADGVVKYTKPLLYPILGGIPRSLQQRLDFSLENFNKKNAFCTSLVVETTAEIAAGIALSLAFWTGWFVPLSIFGVVNGLGRGLTGYEERDSSYSSDIRFKETVGSLVLKPVLFPLEVYFSRKDKKARENGEPKVVEARLGEVDIGNYIDVYSHFREICEKKVSASAAKSLRWGPHNHHSFAKKFRSEAGLEQPKYHIDNEGKVIYDVVESKENNALVCVNKQEIGDFAKVTAAVFMPEENYVLSYIARKAASDGLSFLPVLSSDSPAEKKAESIAKKYRALYTHLTRFEGTKAVEEFVTTN